MEQEALWNLRSPLVSWAPPEDMDHRQCCQPILQRWSTETMLLGRSYKGRPCWREHRSHRSASTSCHHSWIGSSTFPSGPWSRPMLHLHRRTCQSSHLNPMGFVSELVVNHRLLVFTVCHRRDCRGHRSYPYLPQACRDHLLQYSRILKDNLTSCIF